MVCYLLSGFRSFPSWGQWTCSSTVRVSFHRSGNIQKCTTQSTASNWTFIRYWTFIRWTILIWQHTNNICCFFFYFWYKQIPSFIRMKWFQWNQSDWEPQSAFGTRLDFDPATNDHRHHHRLVTLSFCRYS